MPASLVKATNQPAPPPEIGEVLIDTGASMTTVSARALGNLGVSPIGATMIQTPSGSAQQLVYPAEMQFIGINGRMNFASVIGAPALDNQGILALIGRDILSHMVLVYNGPMGAFTLAM